METAIPDDIKLIICMYINADNIEKTTEYHLKKNTVKSQLIYISILISMLMVFLLLPFINVDVTIQADGFIRPKSEKSVIQSLSSGIVSSIYIAEGQYVNKGDTLLVLQNDKIESNIELTNFQIKQNEDFIKDLNVLINTSYFFENSQFYNISRTENIGLLTPYYRQSYVEYLQKIKDLNNRMLKAETEVERNTDLFKKGVIPGKEYDDLKYSLQIAKDELKTFFESAQKNFQNDLIDKKNIKEQLFSQKIQYLQEKQNYSITAPISGSIEQFSGIYKLSNINSGQTIAVLSPNSEKIAELYVLPSDIGYLAIGNPANIQVYAFNYNDWGMLKGVISEISNDYIISGEKAFFRVRCKLDKTDLKLKNGFVGEIKKGMSIHSRFTITSRSLWQLLFDDVNNWLNPNQPQL